MALQACVRRRCQSTPDLRHKQGDEGANPAGGTRDQFAALVNKEMPSTKRLRRRVACRWWQPRATMQLRLRKTRCVSGLTDAQVG